MASLKRYTVTLYPAAKTPSGFRSYSFEIFGGGYPKCSGNAATVDDMLAAAKTLADEHGKPCHASIRCLDKPVPRGFRDATSSTNDATWFNMGAMA